MKALIINEPWISAILEGRKTWGMRKTGCKHRGPITLIRKGSGQVVGAAVISDGKPCLAELFEYSAAEPFHWVRPDQQQRAFADGWRTPWVLSQARALAKPVRYTHPNGAAIWVNVVENVSAQVRRNSR